jgi:hypothetical protein
MQEVRDLDGVFISADTGIDGEMEVHEHHLVAIPLGDTRDEVLPVADGGTDGGMVLCVPN